MIMDALAPSGHMCASSSCMCSARGTIMGANHPPEDDVCAVLPRWCISRLRQASILQTLVLALAIAYTSESARDNSKSHNEACLRN